MRYLFIFLSMFISSCGNATDIGQVFENYLWEKRVVLIFAPDQENENHLKQIRIFDEAKDAMAERDITQWVIINNTRVVKDGAMLPHIGAPKFYRHFNVPAQDFTVILLGKDGEVKLRKKSIVTSSALFSLIDSMPMRKQKMQHK